MSHWRCTRSCGSYDTASLRFTAERFNPETLPSGRTPRGPGMVDAAALESILKEIEHNEGVHEAMLVSLAGTYLAGSVPRGVHVDTFGSMFAVRVGSAVRPLCPGFAGADPLDHVVCAEPAGLQDRHGPPGFIEKMAVASAGLSDRPLRGASACPLIAAAERPRVAGLVGGEARFQQGGLAEPGPEAVRMRRDGDPSQRGDSFDRFPHGKVPEDGFPHAVRDHVS